MSNRYVWTVLLTLLLALASCGSAPTPTVAPPPTAEAPPNTPIDALSTTGEGVFISEVLPGIPGINNNLEFIELYNAGEDAVDMAGWSLWYRLHDAKEEQLVYSWESRTDIPGHGHFLLARAGQKIGNIADAEYNVTLFEKKGGLAVRDAGGQMIDTIVWGEGPSDYVTGSTAVVPDGGASLERLPGGDAGNGIMTGDDSADFALNPDPSPQNSGDAITPLPDERLAVHLDLPASVEPGSEISYSLEVQNLTGQPVHDLEVELPIPAGFEVVSIPDSVEKREGGLKWTAAELAPGTTETTAIQLQSPWTYLSTLISGYYVKASDWPQRAYGPLLPLTVEGGSIPIGTARGLEGKTVSVEGIATMYTDGFFGGSTGTKFYLEDETGGIQAYCPGGKDLVNVQVGDLVRVTGLIEVYRDSIEIIPNTYPDDVEILEEGAGEPAPKPASIIEAGSDESLLGRLTVVEGTVTRNDEFTYSYELDLMDDEGHALLVYIEKEAGLTAEPIEVGKLYRITGISELYDTNWQLKPRLHTDMVEVFPPELMLEMQARNSVMPGEAITYTLVAHNHTDAPLTNVRIVAAPPAEGVSPGEPLDGGRQDEESLVWTIPELAGAGASAQVRYVVNVADDASGQVVAQGAVATANEWSEPVETASLLTFVGSGVPIWAIQGSGMVSPYVRQEASTEGIVIGVFPDLGGFWIQEEESDDNPATSAGLFVLAEELDAPVELGDLVRVTGRIREVSGQTLLGVTNLDDLTVLAERSMLPAAVELDPPMDKAEARVYYEAREGMLAQVSVPAVAVGPTTKYGETALVRSDREIERVMRGDPSGMLIFFDDGGSSTHLDASTLAYGLKTGDQISAVEGPLAYTYENYKIEIISLPVITPTATILPELEPLGPSQFSIATLNVQDLFDASTPHPEDHPIPSTREYLQDLAWTADAIVAMGAPTIVGLQEVENLEVLADLAEQETIAQYTYQPYLIEGTDSRGIDNGYLVRGDQAVVQGATSYPAPEGLTSRPPLLITATIRINAGETTVYVLNNHFSSMSGGELPTEPRRKAQAAWNATLAERILERDPEANVVVLGDLNSFYESPPLDLLREAGLRHVYEFDEPEQPYTYIFQGESETLDHILVTPSLYERLVAVEAVHFNADYPLPDLDDQSFQRMSDHDPLVAIFSLR